MVVDGETGGSADHLLARRPLRMRSTTHYGSGGRSFECPTAATSLAVAGKVYNIDIRGCQDEVGGDFKVDCSGTKTTRAQTRGHLIDDMKVSIVATTTGLLVVVDFQGSACIPGCLYNIECQLEVSNSL